MPDEAPKLPRLPLPLRKQKALKAAWKPLLANWVLPGAGYWMIGQKGRAKAIFGIFVGFTVIGFLQMKLGAGDGPVGGVFTPALDPFQWMPTLGAAATAMMASSLSVVLNSARGLNLEGPRRDLEGTEAARDKAT